MRRLLSELHRRKVLRVAGVYLGIGWALVQAAGWLEGALALPGSFDSIVFAVLAIGFIPIVVVTWHFEITLDGIKRTAPLPAGETVKPETVDWVLAGVLVAVLGVTAAQALWPQSRVAQTSKDASAPVFASAPVEIMKAIAVLPFENMSPRKDDEYFADGLTEEILNLLAKLRGIRVISRTSSFAFKGRKISARDIGKQLSVTHILEGSVRREGNEVRITAQLIDVANDSHVWSHNFEPKLDRIFAVQDEIAASIANALGIEFDYAAGARGAPTRNMRAYRLFLEARESFRSRGKSSLDIAIEKYKRAVALDPAFAEAHAGLAASYFSKASRMNTGYRKYWALAQPSAETARALKPNLAQAYAVLGSLARAQLKWREAFENGAKAVELDPADSNARLWLGLTQFSAGMLEQAERTLEEAQRNDPLYTFIRLWLARVAFARGDDEEGAALAQKLITSTADYRGFGHWYLAYLAQQSGDPDQAEKHYLSAVQVWGTGQPVADRVVKALRAPEQRDATVAALTFEATRDPEFAPETELLLIGEDSAFVEALKARLARGDTDGFGYFLSFLWRAPAATGESFRDLVRSAGLVDYWKANGWPDKCRPGEGEEFVCR